MCRRHTMTESTSELRAPEGIRTPNLLIRRHGRVAWPGVMRVPPMPLIAVGKRVRPAGVMGLASMAMPNVDAA
jgi:hypothetical protein